MGSADGKGGDGLIKAAGGLVWRGPKLAVIHRPKRGDWSLPKGKLKRGEDFAEAALREVAEETGCRPRLGELAGFTLYEVRGRTKLVLFWHMTAESADAFEPNDEVDQLAWLSPGRALARLDNPSERRLVRSVLKVKAARSVRPRASFRLSGAA